MQPHLSLLNTYREISVRVADHVGSVLEETVLIDDERPVPIKVASTAWRTVRRRLGDIDSAIDDFGNAAVTTWTNGSLSEQGQHEQAKAFGLQLDSRLDTATGEVVARVDKILSGLRTAAYPPRPKGGPEAEVALAGIKTDLRMVLENIPAEIALVNRIAALLTRAVADGDDLATWLLASSRWPEDYLESRAAGDLTEALTAEIDRVLDATSAGDLRELRNAYRVVTTPRKGLTALQTLMTGVVPQVSRQLQTWRPSGLRRGLYFNGSDPNSAELTRIAQSGDPATRLEARARDISPAG